jgi:flagellar basal-body rod protein FlgG
MPMGIYSAAAGMAAQQQQLDSIANDLANVNTTGYKKERTGFRDLVYNQNGIGAGSAFVDGGRDFTSGAMQPSSNPLDLALSGSGFFQVKLADGRTALTRDGSLRPDANGELVTSTGQSLAPPIKLPKGTTAADVSITQDGTVKAGGRTLGKIQVVDVTAPAGLQPIGDSLYVATAASGPARAVKTGVEQGMLESSNVDVAGAMTDLIDTQRTFQLTSRVITMQDQLMQIANDIRR